jgi:hypothetical protein
MIKKVQNNEVILMGMGMQINNNSGRSHTTEDSTVSNDRISNSSSMSSTTEESTVFKDSNSTNTPNKSDILMQDAPNKSDILKWDAPVHVSQHSKKQAGSIRFEILQDNSRIMLRQLCIHITRVHTRYATQVRHPQAGCTNPYFTRRCAIQVRHPQAGCTQQVRHPQMGCISPYFTAQ